jgi:hypothetical protein
VCAVVGSPGDTTAGDLASGPLPAPHMTLKRLGLCMSSPYSSLVVFGTVVAIAAAAAAVVVGDAEAAAAEA